MEQGVFYQNADGSIDEVNDAALRLFGISRDEFLGRTSMNPEWKVVDINGNTIPGDRHPSMEALRTGKEIKNSLLGVFNPVLQDFLGFISMQNQCSKPMKKSLIKYSLHSMI
jgi:two-component system cell cycle sensor histidine kinase/response regulator CckA